MAQPQRNPANEQESLLADLRSYQREQEEDPTNHLPPYHCGMIHTRLGGYDEAIGSYLLSIQCKPDFYQAQFNLASVYAAQGKWGEAEQTYINALQQNPSDAEGWANLGVVHENLGQENEAIESYSKAVELDPDEHEARLRLGRLHHQKGNLDEAQRVFAQVLERDPSNVEIQNSLGLVHYHMKEYEEAERCYRKALSLDDKNANAWSNLGNVLAVRGDEAGTTNAYKMAVQIAPSDSDFWFNLGEHYFQHGHRETEKSLLKVIEINRRDEEAMQLLHRWYQDHANDDRHKYILQALSALNPEDLDVLREVAEIHERTRDFKEAMEALRKLDRLKPEKGVWRMSMARVHLKEGLLLEAFKEMRQVEDTSPPAQDFRVYLAQRLLHQDKLPEAETMLNIVVKQRPELLDAWYFLGEVSLLGKDWLKAFERFTQATEICHNDRRVWLTLHKALLEMEEFDKAADCLMHLDELMRFLPEAWFRLLETYQKAGRHEAYLKGLEKLLELNLINPRYWLLLGELYERAGMTERAADCRLRAPAGANLKGVNTAWTAEYKDLRKDRRGQTRDGRVRSASGQSRELLLESEMAEGGPNAGQTLPGGSAGAGTGAGGTAAAGGGAGGGTGGTAAGGETGGFDPFEVGGSADGTQRGADRTEGESEEEKDSAYWLAESERLYQQGLVKQAIEAIRKALALDSYYFPGWFQLGSLLFMADQLDEAESAFRTAGNLNPGEAKCWYNMGVCQAEQKKFGMAAHSFDQVLAKDDKFAKAWDWIGVLHLVKDDLEKAHGAFLRCVELDPELANGWYNLGMVYQTMGRKKEAAECQKKAEKLGGVEAAVPPGSRGVHRDALSRYTKGTL